MFYRTHYILYIMDLLNLEALRVLLGVSWAYLRSKWPPDGIQVASNRIPSGFQGQSEWPPSALATLRTGLSPTRELNSHVLALLPSKTAF